MILAKQEKDLHEFQYVFAMCRLCLSPSPHQDSLEVPLQEVPERGQEVDGRALDELALSAANLLLRLSTLDQSVSCTSQKDQTV